jgi:hypothetical protein
VASVTESPVTTPDTTASPILNGETWAAYLQNLFGGGGLTDGTTVMQFAREWESVSPLQDPYCAMHSYSTVIQPEETPASDGGEYNGENIPDEEPGGDYSGN